MKQKSRVQYSERQKRVDIEQIHMEIDQLNEQIKQLKGRLKLFESLKIDCP